jgi:polygalacturonase
MPSIPRNTVGLAVAALLLLNALPLTVGCARAQEIQPPSAAPTSAPASPVALPQIPDRTFNVKEYGAAGDGIQDDAPAIQKALDAAGDAGGGMVVIPAGTFLSGPLTLHNRTGIHLHLAEGAVLRMLPLDRYPAPSQGEYPPFIHARRAQDILISGPGMMDGQGQAWWQAFRSGAIKDQRPEMLCFFRPTRLAIRNLKMQNGPKAHIDIGRSSNITIDGVTITAPDESPNTDGIDVWGTNIVIKNCTIDSGDDHVAISGNTANVSITGCKFGVGHGVSIGSSTRGGVNNMIVDHCQFDGSVNGFRGKTNRNKGGVVENLLYSNITMTNVRYPIRFESIYDLKLKQAEQTQTQPAAATTPIWRNITFTNITATVADKYQAGILWGLPEAPIENVLFKNVNITAYKGFKIYFAKGVVFSPDCRIQITGTSAPLLLYESQVEAPESWQRGGPRPGPAQAAEE